MKVTLDIAALISAVIWPAAVLVIFLAYRKAIPGWVGALAGRVTKLGFAGFSVEVAIAKPFAPDWTVAPKALDLPGAAAIQLSTAPAELDLRRNATAMEITDSTAASFSQQLLEGGYADYAEVNLAGGQAWLTSRLYIIAIVFARRKGIRGMVFLEEVGGQPRRFVGWASPADVRWTLARRFPWLEAAFAEAYATLFTQPTGFVVSDAERLGALGAANDPAASLQLIREFLVRLQSPPLPPPPDPANWIDVAGASSSWEHAQWIGGAFLRDVLGDHLIRSTATEAELTSMRGADLIAAMLRRPGAFVAVTGEGRRLEYVLDRQVLLEQALTSAISR